MPFEKIKRDIINKAEREVVTAIFKAANDKKLLFDVHDEFREIQERREPRRLIKRLTAIGHVFNHEDCFIALYYTNGELYGWIRLIFGNDGWDSINDYSTNLESFIQTGLIGETIKKWEDYITAP